MLCVGIPHSLELWLMRFCTCKKEATTKKRTIQILKHCTTVLEIWWGILISSGNRRLDTLRGTSRGVVSLPYLFLRGFVLALRYAPTPMDAINVRSACSTAVTWGYSTAGIIYGDSDTERFLLNLGLGKAEEGDRCGEEVLQVHVVGLFFCSFLQAIKRLRVLDISARIWVCEHKNDSQHRPAV